MGPNPAGAEARLYAGTTHSLRTNLTTVVVSPYSAGGRLKPISAAAVDFIERLIAADGRGIPSNAITAVDRVAVEEIESLGGLRLRRRGSLPRLSFANSVALVDQRTFATEAA